MSTTTETPTGDLVPAPPDGDGRTDWLLGAGLLGRDPLRRRSRSSSPWSSPTGRWRLERRGAAAPAATVSLSEFAISPEMVSATTAGGLDISNTGNVAHDLAVQDTDVVSATIAPGQSGPSRSVQPLTPAPTRSTARSPVTPTRA